MPVRVRYAPSPTGHLHIGGVRTALFNYLFARHHGGQFILRVEDTDLERNVPGAQEEMLDGFRWLGFTWDEGPDIGGPYGPYRCTERLEHYREALEQLVAGGWAYPCFCNPEVLEQERQEALQEGRVPRYSGRCRHLSPEDRERRLQAGEVPNWRFAVPPGRRLAFVDGVRGEMSFVSDDLGDFVIVKSNGMPTYNFQVVVDDAAMRITHVIRGEEHLSNTPRQLLIYEALGLTPPAFAHLPQVLNRDRKKLSKRDPDVQPLHVYREQGFVPEALVNFLALLGWSPGGEEEILSVDELIARFDLHRVGHSGAVFDVDKLRWMAGVYLRALPLAGLTAMVREQLDRHGVALPEGVGEDWLERVAALHQEHLACAADFLREAAGFFTPEVTWSDDARAVLREGGAEAVVRMYLELARDDEEWTAAASRARFARIQRELGVKGRRLYMPVRAAVTGQVHGPDLQETIALLPKPWAIRRLEAAVRLTTPGAAIQ
ncbi:glutamate--tRNA ligase [Alicyclobacillus sp.]|uniref:glutamate--tRNA ligase n=1 Tax=Alicyclobacillus sp. TaxID=61169 RepID=UPI0025B8C504|nr:glutamate--tRNA ligase [Alicyclobacillus sp.]MCL6517304.1 glutamate--tRNA ligase [Alicyclobacillus sp.]